MAEMAFSSVIACLSVQLCTLCKVGGSRDPVTGDVNTQSRLFFSLAAARQTFQLFLLRSKESPEHTAIHTEASRAPRALHHPLK